MQRSKNENVLKIEENLLGFVTVTNLKIKQQMIRFKNTKANEQLCHQRRHTTAHKCLKGGSVLFITGHWSVAATQHTS